MSQPYAVLYNTGRMNYLRSRGVDTLGLVCCITAPGSARAPEAPVRQRGVDVVGIVTGAELEEEPG